MRSSANSDLDQSLKLDPKYVRAYIRRGQLQVGLKEYHKALESYQHALDLEPDNAEAKEGLRNVIAKINASSQSSEADPEREWQNRGITGRHVPFLMLTQPDSLPIVTARFLSGQCILLHACRRPPCARGPRDPKYFTRSDGK